MSSALTPRLRALREMARGRYGAVWDLGSDHGLLANAIAADGGAETVHAVDRVGRVCDQLSARFPRLSVHCADWHQLVLTPDAGKTLVVVAGVGGDTVAEAVESLIVRHPSQPLDFLLCPVRQCWALRTRLAALPLRVDRERVVSDRGRYYEILQLSTHPAPPEVLRPWPAGRSLWGGSAVVDQYLAERVHAHRHRPEIAAQYQALLSSQGQGENTCVG